MLHVWTIPYQGGPFADISTPDNRGKMMSTFQGAFLLGSTAGPTVGGLLVHLSDWRAVFSRTRGRLQQDKGWS